MGYDFNQDPFSFPFNVLTYMGLWLLETDNAVKKSLYRYYKLFIALYQWQLVILGFVDLYLNRDDFEKVIYNLCTTIFVLAVTVKHSHVMGKAGRINELRVKLFKDLSVQKNEEHIEIINKFRHTLKIIKIVFYVAFVTFYPIWLISSLLTLKWGPRKLPFPVWLPLNLEDNSQFFVGFIYFSLSGVFLVAEAAHTDLGMYSLVLQISGQYSVMKKKLMKVNELFTNANDCQLNGNGQTTKKTEINIILKQHRIREKFKKFLKRQLELKQCVMELEDSYNLVMVIQLLCGLILSIGYAMEFVVSKDFSMKKLDLIVFFIMILSDLFICCSLADSLLDECDEINFALYSLAWYEMDNHFRKDVLLMKMGSQYFPILTVGKLFPLNLKTYLGLIKNLYSWLALLRQVVMKK